MKTLDYSLNNDIFLPGIIILVGEDICQENMCIICNLILFEEELSYHN